MKRKQKIMAILEGAAIITWEYILPIVFGMIGAIIGNLIFYALR